MAQAVSENNTFDPRRDPHSALSDDSVHRLKQVSEALAAIAELTNAGANGSDPEVTRNNLVSLFLLLSRNCGAAIDDAIYVVN